MRIHLELGRRLSKILASSGYPGPRSDRAPSSGALQVQVREARMVEGNALGLEYATCRRGRWRSCPRASVGISKEENTESDPESSSAQGKER